MLKLLNQFQFLYGAIKTPAANIHCRDGVGFQFLYGAIKTLMRSAVTGVKSSFNSSMVRLKHFVLIDESVVMKFQFLYGAIKTGVGHLKNLEGMVSIPLWCD